MPFPLPAALVLAASLISAPASGPVQGNPDPAAANERAVREVPLILAENRLLVPVEIHGVGRTFFILDTAASRTVISGQLRQQLTLDPAAIRERSVQGSTGSTTMEFVKLPVTKVGGTSHSDLWAVVADISDFRDYGSRSVTGILGTDLLSKYDVEIDVPSRALRLHSGPVSASRAAKGTVLPFHSSGDTQFVQFTATIGGKPVQALLDTGARSGILNWKAAGLAEIEPGTDGIVTERSGSEGIGGQQLPQYRSRVNGICFADHCLSARELRIADLPVFGVVGKAEQPAMLIGVEWLKDCPILISYSTGRLHICG